MQTTFKPIEHMTTSCLDKKMSLKIICGEAIDMISDLILDKINRAVEYSDEKYSNNDIVNMVKSREATLFYVIENGEIIACLVAKINTYPKSKRCCLFMISGDRIDEWISYLSEIKTWAISQGCDAFELLGRVGWERRLYSLGFEKTHVLLRSKIKDMQCQAI